MKKNIIIGSLMIAILILSGCAVSNYITGTEKDYSLLDENNGDEKKVDELDKLLDEIDDIDEKTNKELIEELSENAGLDIKEEAKTEETVEEEIAHGISNTPTPAALHLVVQLFGRCLPGINSPVDFTFSLVGGVHFPS